MLSSQRTTRHQHKKQQQSFLSHHHIIDFDRTYDILGGPITIRWFTFMPCNWEQLPFTPSSTRVHATWKKVHISRTSHTSLI